MNECERFIVQGKVEYHLTPSASRFAKSLTLALLQMIIITEKALTQFPGLHSFEELTSVEFLAYNFS